MSVRDRMLWSGRSDEEIERSVESLKKTRKERKMNSLKNKITVVRDVIEIINEGFESVAINQCAVLKMEGFQNGQYEGDPRFENLDTQNATLEEKHMAIDWYAGQIIKIIDERAWHGINSLINTCDMFAPKEWIEDETI